MSPKGKAAPQTPTGAGKISKLLKPYGCSPGKFVGTDNAFYERHLVFDNVVEPTAAGPRERLEAVARSVWRKVTSQQVAGSRGWYSPRWHYDHEPEPRAALDLIVSDHFSRYEPGVFAPLHDTLLTHGDYYMHLVDLMSYLEADQRLRELYADSDAWARQAILNVASSGKFSSDRTIAEYAADIWKVAPCPVI
jgi:Carbohydrate phosphorylase